MSSDENVDRHARDLAALFRHLLRASAGGVGISRIADAVLAAAVSLREMLEAERGDGFGDTEAIHAAIAKAVNGRYETDFEDDRDRNALIGAAFKLAAARLQDAAHLESNAERKLDELAEYVIERKRWRQEKRRA